MTLILRRLILRCHTLSYRFLTLFYLRLTLSYPTLSVVGRLTAPRQTKESARRYVIYCEALGHMFLLVGCGRGARPYVSIMCRYAKFFYCLSVCVSLCHFFLLCGARLCFYWLAVGVALGH